MEDFVREAMHAGALGLSTGLEFNPGRMAPTDELVRLNKVVGEYDGYYTSHIRNRDSQLQESIEEFLTIIAEFPFQLDVDPAAGLNRAPSSKEIAWSARPPATGRRCGSRRASCLFDGTRGW